MNKLINRVFFYTKIIFLLIAFTTTLYILLIRMDSYSLPITSILSLFIPLLLVLIIFIFSLFLNIGKDNIFFNIICILVLLAIMLVNYRTIFDNNIISNTQINLNYFDLNTNKIIIMSYLMFIANILLIIYEKKKKIHS